MNTVKVQPKKIIRSAKFGISKYLCKFLLFSKYIFIV